MNIDYNKLPRLAELCEAISDKENCQDIGVTTTIEVMTTVGRPQLAVIMSSWRKDFDIEQYYMTTNTYEDHTYTIDEMIAVLEQIESCGYRNQSEVAA